MVWTKVKWAVVAVTVAVLGDGGVLVAEEPPQAPAAGAVTVLSSDSCLRSHLVFKTPVMVTKDGEVRPVPNPNRKATGPLPEFQSRSGTGTARLLRPVQRSTRIATPVPRIR